jgi:hypothetical protein
MKIGYLSFVFIVAINIIVPTNTVAAMTHSSILVFLLSYVSDRK